MGLFFVQSTKYRTPCGAPCPRRAQPFFRRCVRGLNTYLPATLISNCRPPPPPPFQRPLALCKSKVSPALAGPLRAGVREPGYARAAAAGTRPDLPDTNAFPTTKKRPLTPPTPVSQPHSSMVGTLSVGTHGGGGLLRLPVLGG